MKRWQIGKTTITCVVEMGDMPTSPKFFFNNPPADLVSRNDWLLPHFANEQGRLLMSIQCFVIESEGKRIVVDTCVGNDKQRANKFWTNLQLPFLNDLQAAGFSPESIDYVLCTHLHVDHVGWNTRKVDGRWVATFPNARYLFARKEWEHWTSEAARPPQYAGNAVDAEVPVEDVIGDSVKPIVDAGLADLVETDHRITSEVCLQPTPGHTPGHVSVRISSQGQDAVITGDLMHHPIQCAEPDLPVNFDHRLEEARLTRRNFLDCCAREKLLVLGTHFATPTAGHVVAGERNWRFKAWQGQ